MHRTCTGFAIAVRRGTVAVGLRRSAPNSGLGNVICVQERHKSCRIFPRISAPVKVRTRLRDREERKRTRAISDSRERYSRSARGARGETRRTCGWPSRWPGSRLSTTNRIGSEGEGERGGRRETDGQRIKVAARGEVAQCGQLARPRGTRLSQRGVLAGLRAASASALKRHHTEIESQ